MTSYKTIAEIIAQSLNQPKNYPLKQALIQDAKELRALYLRQDAERNGGSATYMQSTVIELQVSDTVDSCLFDVEDNCALRSVFTIPEPVRIKDIAPFSFIGSVNRKKPFTYTPLETLEFTKHNKYTCNIPRYDYINGYIYVFNMPKKLKYALIESAFVDPTEIVTLCTETEDCIDDSTQIPIPSDVVARIKDTLKNRYMGSVSDLEVRLNPDGANNN